MKKKIKPSLAKEGILAFAPKRFLLQRIRDVELVVFASILHLIYFFDHTYCVVLFSTLHLLYFSDHTYCVVSFLDPLHLESKPLLLA